VSDDDKSYDVGRYHGSHADVKNWDAYQRGVADRARWDAATSQSKPATRASDPYPAHRTQGSPGSGGAGGGGGSGEPGILLYLFYAIVWVLVFPLVVLFAPLLYPIPAAAAFGVGYGIWSILRDLAPVQTFDLVVVAIPALVVFWLLSRADHTVAHRVTSYRVLRHLLRLAIMVALFVGLPLQQPSGRQIVGALVVVAVAHLVLRSSFSDAWHWVQTSIGLRPSSFRVRARRRGVARTSPKHDRPSAT
jgi:hypothetical protein